MGGMGQTRIEVEESFWRERKGKDSSLRDKFKHRWFREKDTNIKFFHAGLQVRRRNQIISINKNGSGLEGVDEVKGEILNHFTSFFIPYCRKTKA